MNPVSGLWMRRNVGVNPQFSPWVVASNRHHNEDAVPDRIRQGIIDAPQYYPTDGDIPDYTGGTPQVPSGEPRTHQGVRRHPGMTQQELRGVHSENHGMVDRKSKADGPTRFVDDAWQIHLTQDMDGTQAARGAGGRPDLVRGLNAFPENNPPKDMYNGHGWRRAQWQKRWFTHNLVPRQRKHGLRPIFLRTTAPRTNIPPNQGSIYNGISYGTLDKARRQNLTIPRMRRQPPFIDTSVIQDRWAGSQANVVDVI
jgi:hypothetical protein